MPKNEDLKLPSKEEVIEKYKNVLERNKAHARGEKSQEELLEEELQFQEEEAKTLAKQTKLNAIAEEKESRAATKQAKLEAKQAAKQAKLDEKIAIREQKLQNRELNSDQETIEDPIFSHEESGVQNEQQTLFEEFDEEIYENKNEEFLVFDNDDFSNTNSKESKVAAKQAKLEAKKAAKQAKLDEKIAKNALKNEQNNQIKSNDLFVNDELIFIEKENKLMVEQQEIEISVGDDNQNFALKSLKKPKKQKELNEPKIVEQKERKYVVVDDQPAFNKGVKGLKQRQKYQKQLTNKFSKRILLNEDIVTTQEYKPDTEKHIIELKNVRKSYQTGDLETPILKGVDIVLNKKDFIVILGPSGSGKTTFLNVISGLDKATEGDVFVLGSNLSLLKDSHLTKFRRRNVGFIFQQYNLLTNLTAKENAEVGQNLANKTKRGLSIEEIFETIGMTDQINKYPHQMSGGQQQRVSIARALAKNPEILFADEPTGALDEEMGRKVLEILVKVNKEYHTTIVVVTHNPNIAKIANTIIHIKNGLIDSLEKNKNPADPQSIEWS